MTLNLIDKNVIQTCKFLLDALYLKHKQLYVDLFFYEKDVLFGDFSLEPLVLVGILQRQKNNKLRAQVQVFPMSGKFICTDFNYSLHRKRGKTFLTQKDGVWGILPEETPVMAKKVVVHRGDIVLDLATGSGMIAIFCADRAQRVIATDINPKAIHYARFNAILNGVDDKIDFRVGDLFSAVKGEKFDLIVWNGPTVAVPETSGKYPIYSDGGIDGISFTRRFVDSALDYLTPTGRLQWYDCAVGTEKMPVSMEYLQSQWNSKGLRVLYHSLTSDAVSLTKSFAIYEKYNLNQPSFKTPLSCQAVTKKEEEKWHVWLTSSGYTHFYYAFVEVRPATKFSLTFQFPDKDVRSDRYLTRFWLWMSYARIYRMLKWCEKL